jgi:hypothetical protein
MPRLRRVLLVRVFSGSLFMRPHAPPWKGSPVRAELVALYAQIDARLGGWTCACSRLDRPREPTCCQFAVTGLEPHATPVELAEVRHAMRAAGMGLRDARRLPVAGRGECPLLSRDGRCRIYASRPFGCRTFFCPQAEGPPGISRRDLRPTVNDIGRRIADLSARFDPVDPLPRPMVRALSIA